MPSTPPPLGSGSSLNYVDVPIFNQTVPNEGPKTIPLRVDWSIATTQDLDLQNIQSRAFISVIQGLFIDNKAHDYFIDISTGVTGQTIRIPANHQAYVPILQPNPPRLTFSTAQAAAGGVTDIQLLNIPIAPAIWSLNDAASSFDELYELFNTNTAMVQSTLYTQGSSSLRKPFFNADASGFAVLAAAGTDNVFSPGADLGWVLTSFRAYVEEPATITGGGTLGVNIQNAAAGAVFEASLSIADTVTIPAGTVIADFRDLQYMAATDAHDLIMQYTGTALTTGGIGLMVTYAASTPNLATV